MILKANFKHLLEKLRVHSPFFLILLAFIVFFLFVRRDVIFRPDILSILDILNFPHEISLHLGWYSAWIPEGLGLQSWFPPFAAILRPLFTVLSFGNPIVAQKLLLTYSLVGCVTMYFFLGNHVTRSRAFKFLGAILYGYGPPVAYLSGADPQWGYALLPLPMNYLFNILDEKRTKRWDPILFALTFLLASANLRTLLLTFPLIVIVFFLVNVITRRSKVSYLVHFFKNFLLSAGILWLSTRFISNVFRVYIVSYSTSFSIPENWYYRYCTVLNMLSSGGRLDPLRDKPIGLFLPITAFSALFLARKREIRIKAIAFSSIALLLVAFSAAVHSYQYGSSFPSWWFPWLYENFPIIIALRSPEKVQYIITFAYSSLIIIVAEEVIRRINSSEVIIKTKNRVFHISIDKGSMSIILSLLLIASYFAYCPAYDLAQFSREGIGWAPQPKSYDVMRKWLDAHQDDYRYAVVPLTETAFLAVSPDHPKLLHAERSFTSQAINYMIYVNDALLNETYKIGTLLAPANVKYYMVPLDSIELGVYATDIQGPPHRKEYKLIGKPETYANLLDQQEELRLVYSDDGLLIYENEIFIPHMSTFSKSIYLLGDRNGLNYLASLPYFDIRENLVIFGEQYPNEDLLEGSDVIAFDNRYISDLSLSLLVKDYGTELWRFGSSNTITQAMWFKSTQSRIGQHLDRGDFFTYGNNAGYIEAKRDASVDIPFQVQSSSLHELWLRSLHSPSTNGTLSFFIDEEPFGEEIQPIAKKFLGFCWVKLGTLLLNKGEHKLTIKNKDGYNALDELVVVPTEVFQETLTRLSIHIEEKKMIFLYDESPLEKTQLNLEYGSEVISDDNQTAFWAPFNRLKPEKAPTISDDVTERAKGLNSLKVDVPVDLGEWSGVKHDFFSPVDWSDKNFLSLYLYGLNDGSAILVNFNFATGWGWYEITDNWSGWRQIIIPLNDPEWEESGEGIDWSIVNKIRVLWSTPGTRYLDECRISVGSFESSGKIHVPLKGQYSVAVKSTYTTQKLLEAVVDDIEMSLYDLGLGWYETESFPLEVGAHNISIKHENAYFEKFAVVFGIRLKDIFSNSSNNAVYSTEKISETKYVLEVQSKKPSFIVLAESYNLGWSATADGKDLLHFPAFSVTNGFYLNSTGSNRITIEFKPQKYYVAVAIFKPLYLVTLLAIVTYWDALKHKSKKRITWRLKKWRKLQRSIE